MTDMPTRLDYAFAHSPLGRSLSRIAKPAKLPRKRNVMGKITNAVCQR
jgi:hypothetical protein